MTLTQQQREDLRRAREAVANARTPREWLAREREYWALRERYSGKPVQAALFEQGEGPCAR